MLYRLKARYRGCRASVPPVKSPGELHGSQRVWRCILMAEASSDLPGNKLFALLRESRWILLVACALYFTVALYGYDPADPAWSHSVTGAQTTNPGGVLGAYLSDLLFYLFGFSAWWWVLFLLQRVWAGYHSCVPTASSASARCGSRSPGLRRCCCPAARSSRSVCTR